jgi:4'-phosphopantetheinyl transferase
LDPQKNSATLDLDQDEIHLWFCRDGEIVDNALLNRYYHQLDDAERKRQGRFYFEKHRHQYLVTRAMVRNTLSLYAGDVSPEQWRFSPNEYGKPHISAPIARPLQFNLSHASGMIVLAITRSREVGVDVECQSRGEKSPERADIADRFFSPREARDLRSLPMHRQADRFYDLWTLKEAYIKACGKGLSMPLDEFGFRFPCSHGVDIEFSSEITDDPRNWKFWLLKASEDHKVALAIKGDAAEDPFHISLREIVPAECYRVASWPYLRSSAGVHPHP